MKTSPPRFGRALILITVFASGLGAGWMGSFLGHRSGKTQAGEDSELQSSGLLAHRSGGERSGGQGQGNGGEAGVRPLGAAASKEFAESVHAIFRETDEDRRVAAFDRLLERATPAHLAALVDLIRENDLNGNGSASEWSHLWVRWGRTDAQGALQFIEGKTWDGWDPLAPQEAKRKAISSWVQADARSALGYFEQSGDIERGDRTLVYPIVRGLCNSDPDMAMEWLAKTGLARGDEYKAVIDAQRRQKGMAETDGWFDQLAASGMQDKDINGLARSILSSRQMLDPEKAAEWVEARKDAPWLEQSGLIQSTAGAYAQKDPQAALEWAQKLPPSQASAAASYAWPQWMEKEPTQAFSWLEQHTDSPIYNTAAIASAEYLASANPSQVQEFVQKIPDENVRAEALVRVGQVTEALRRYQQKHSGGQNSEGN